MSLREEIIEKIDKLENVPAAGIQAIRVLLNPNSNMGEIVQIIKYDPGLTSNILKLANSSYFGMPGSIASLRDALIRLGTANVLTLITTSMANVAMKKPIKGYGLSGGELWTHSTAVAAASETASDILKVDIGFTKIAFTAGLLHDIGKIVLGEFIKENVKTEIEKLLDKKYSFVKAEQEILGIDHAELGGIVMENWNLPRNMVDIVRWHHEPEKCEHLAPGIVHIADYICVFNRIGTKRKNPLTTAFSQETFKRLSFNNQARKEIIERTKNNLEVIQDVFSKHNE